MPMRSIRICYRDHDNGVQIIDCRQNDPRAESEIEHTLVVDGRYLVSPIHSQKSPKFRARSCVFLRPCKNCSGKIKAIVRFEDDGSEAFLDPGDLLPYEKDLPICYGSKDGVLKVTNSDGLLSEQLMRLRELAFDIDKDAFRDKFRFLLGFWFCMHYKLDESKDTQLIKDLDCKLCQMLGPGHSICSCVQFMEGKKGNCAFEKLESKMETLVLK